MSYTQKMRSWLMSGLLAVTALLLWKTAQNLPTREHLTTEDSGLTTEEMILDARNRIRMLELRLNTGATSQQIQANELNEKLKELQK
jgi:hypothetical protein